MAQQSACPVLMTGVPSCCGRPKAALHMGVPHRQDTITCTQQQPLTSSLLRSLCQRQLPLHPGWWLLPLSPDQWPYPRPMHRPQAVAVSTPALPPPTSAFVVAAEPATTKVESDLFFGDLEGLETPQRPDSVDNELVEELVEEIQHIKGNSGVGSPEVRKYVDAWSPPEAPFLQVGSSKDAALRALAEALYQRRPVLYLNGHAKAYPAQVLLRTVRKPSVGALSTAAAAAGLFKSPSNTVIVIKFDPQFGYADIIVDPFFTDAFIQQPSTPTYSQLLTQLPRAFVGTAVELRRVVALLTQQSMRAYASKAAAIPPWRRFDAMLARWLPKRYTDEPITHGPGSTTAAGASAAAASGELLRRSDSSSSSSNEGVGSSDISSSSSSSSRAWSFSVVGAGGSFGSSSVASPVPRTVVYGFDIPAKAPSAAAAAAAGPEPAADVAPATDAVVAAVAAIPAAAVSGSSKPAALDSVSAKLAAAAAAEHSSAAAASSWQLAVGSFAEEAVDDSDGCLSSSSTSENNTQKLAFAARAWQSASEDGDDQYAGESAISGPAAAAAAVDQPAPAAVTADRSAQLLTAHGYSSRVVKLQNPAAAAAASAAAAAAAGARERGGARVLAAVNTAQLRLPQGGVAVGNTASTAVNADAIKPGGAPGNERVCCGFGDLTACNLAPVHSTTAATCFDGGTEGKVGGQLEAIGLAAAVARIRDAVMTVDVAAGVPAGGDKPRVIWGRKVVRFDAVGGVLQGRTQFGSARAA